MTLISRVFQKLHSSVTALLKGLGLGLPVCVGSSVVTVRQFMSDSAPLSCGAPQGSVLGPMLFTLNMWPLSHIVISLTGTLASLYADGFQSYFSFKAGENEGLTIFLGCPDSVQFWMTENCLQLNKNKTQALIITPWKVALGIRQNIGFLSDYVQRNLRSLGVIHDQLMNITKLRLRLFMPLFILTWNALFTWLNQTFVNWLANCLKYSCWILHGKKNLSSLHWLPVIFHIQFNRLLLTFRALHDQSPQYIADLLPYSANRALSSPKKKKKICCLSLRSTFKREVTVPLRRLHQNFGKFSFSFEILGLLWCFYEAAMNLLLHTL